MRLRKEMEAIRARGEFCVCSGDLNKLVGRGEGGIPGNHPEISLGGRLLRGLLITGDWVLVNGLGGEIVEGGPFTRKDPATGKESCLDLFIVSRELLPYVSNLYIDSGRKIAVSRAVKKGASYKLVFSNHYTCLLTLKNLPRRREVKGDKRVAWNLAKEGGWEKYKELTEVYSENLGKAIHGEVSIEDKMGRFDRIHNKIKYMAFGKVRIGSNAKNMTMIWESQKVP